jgi:hypothetical protein
MSTALETYLLAGAGHDLNLATDTQDYQRAVLSWANTFVGTGSAVVADPPCSP